MGKDNKNEEMDNTDKKLNESDVMNNIYIPSKPNPPLDRIIREGVAHYCNICGSTMSKSGFLRIFGKRYCDNNECSNSN